MKSKNLRQRSRPPSCPPRGEHHNGGSSLSFSYKQTVTISSQTELCCYQMHRTVQYISLKTLVNLLCSPTDNSMSNFIELVAQSRIVAAVTFHLPSLPKWGMSQTYFGTFPFQYESSPSVIRSSLGMWERGAVSLRTPGHAHPTSIFNFNFKMYN